MSLLQFLLINVNLLAFFGLFLLFSRGKRHLHFNRFYLILTPIISAILPFISIRNASSSVTWVSELPTVNLLRSRSLIGSEMISFETVIYSVGALLFLSILIFQIYSIIKPKKATYLKSFNGASVYLLNSDEATHSFFKRIYLSPENLDNEKIILIHEHEHCRGYHSIDLLIIAVFKSLFWFNPIIYAWGKLVKENHEFIADQKVMSENISAWNYGRLLLDDNFRSTAPHLTNTFNTKSMLLKRIENLNLKNQYPMKNLLVIPVLAGLALFSMSMTDENTVAKSTASSTIVKGEDPEVKAEYPGGMDAMFAFLGKEAKYPKSLEKEGPEGKVFVEFTITKSGKVTDVNLKKASGYDAMDDEAIRMVEAMPNWKPAQKDGLAIKSKMTLPIVFKINS
jgi:TonB family protein